MTVINISEPRYTSVGVTVTISTSEFGIIEFHAMPTDPAISGRLIYEEAIRGDFGPIAPMLEEN